MCRYVDVEETDEDRLQRLRLFVLRAKERAQMVQVQRIEEQCARTREALDGG